MADEVGRIYESLEELNRKIEKLESFSKLEKRVKQLEEDNKIITTFLLQGLRPLIQMVNKIPIFK